MVLATMRFSGYEWKYNPVTLRVSHVLSHSKRRLSLSFEEVSDPALQVKVVTGKGVFTGEDCIEQYKEMEAVFLKGAKGVLVMPDCAAVYAYFTKFSAEASDTPDVIEYSFEFTQADSEDMGIKPQYHTANGWESLYTIGGDYGVKQSTPTE